MDNSAPVSKQLIGEMGGKQIYRVDGGQVRKDHDREFTNWGASHQYKFIPSNEIWLDHEVHQAEAPIFIDRALKEGRMVAGGKSVPDARKAGDRYEESERAKIFGGFGTEEREAHEGDPRLQQIPLPLTPGAPTTLKMFIVDGEKIRNGQGTQHENFTEGGNHGAYRWIPKNEVWLEQGMSPEEGAHTALHELHERRHILGAGESYLKAHRSASVVEHYAREHPEVLPALLQSEIYANERT
jgi:hypothetical protein